VPEQNKAITQQMARTMENKTEESKVRKTLSNRKETGMEKWILQYNFVLCISVLTKMKWDILF
jgi:hypothetical protein